MFSYLRPHRRAPSNPTSPAEQVPTWESSLRAPADHAHPQRYPGGRPPESATSPSQGLSLPPIARVTSADSDLLVERGRSATYEREQDAQTFERLRDNGRSRDTHAPLTVPRKPVEGTQRPESRGNASSSQQTGFQHSRPQMAGNQDFSQGQRPIDPNATFVRQATGTRLPTPPPSAANTISAYESSRSGKRLNLLNPMSLLARRRTNNVITQSSTESTTSSRLKEQFNDSFDPRIKGTVVHDFSAPRPRRVAPSNTLSPDRNGASHLKQFQSPQLQQGRIAADGNHTPAFIEDFEEEQYPAAGPHVRKANDFSDLTVPKLPYAEDGQRPVLKSSNNNNNAESDPRLQTSKGRPEANESQNPKGRSSPSEGRRISIDPSSTSPKSTPSKKRQSRKSDVSVRNSGSISRSRHMKSTSSRFSFDMIGAAEQERLLEDRHRQRALEKENERAARGGDFDDFDEEFNYDDMDDDDGLEERIPGVNADFDEEDEEDEADDEPYNYLQQQVPFINNGATAGDALGSIPPLPFNQQQLSTPLRPYSPAPPQGGNEDVTGIDSTEDTHAKNASSTAKTWRESSTFGPPMTGSLKVRSGTGSINTRNSAEPALRPAKSTDSRTSEYSQPSGVEQDDLYYDDGLIDELGEVPESGEFDESIFDNIDTDEFGRPLKPLSQLTTLYSPPMLAPDMAPSEKVVESGDGMQGARRKDTVPTETGRPEIALAPRPSVAARDQPPEQLNNLTHDSLAAYQSALAAAAFNAAASGRFRRDSVQTARTPSEQGETQPGLISDSSHTSHYEPFSPNYDFEDDFDYDDALDDDPIIAAANAEALANDMDGFYGQEFGFYSVPSDEAEYANGGYFGPRGVDGIGRTQSGRIASREPNLTPITERSEYSNRNSFMSIPMHRPESLINPGLAQLAGMPEYEDNITLDALLKLRRGAWGGSQASLHSSNGSPRSAGADETSPVGPLSPWTQNISPNLPMGGHRRHNSGFSGFSIASEGAGGVQNEQCPAPLSPTIMAIPSTLEELSAPAGADKERENAIKKHRYTTSAESISYSKEDDPQSPTGDRWVLERRRTSEHGVELLGREVISGGAI